MKSADREAALLVKLARVRARVVDVREEMEEAGFEKTAERIEQSVRWLDMAKASLMTAIRESGEAAGRKR